MAEYDRNDRIKQILADAEKRFDAFQDNLYNAAMAAKSSRDSKRKEKVIISVSKLSNEQRQRLDALNKKIRQYKISIKEGKDYLTIQKEQKQCIEKVYSYSPLMDPKIFYDSISAIEVPNVKEGLFKILYDYSSLSKIPFPFGKKYINDIYNKFMTAFVLNDTNYDEELNKYRVQIIPLHKNIMKVLGPKEKYIDYYDKTIEFMEDSLDIFNASLDDLLAEKEEFKKEIAKQLHIEAVQDENKELQSLKEQYDKLVQIEKLANEYNETGNQKTLNKLGFLLMDLGIITNRDFKYLTHDEPVKYDEITVEDKPEVVEEFQVEDKEPRKLEDALYFADKDTQTIICFLGKEDRNEILEDLYEYLDKPQREDASAELIRLFNGLYNDKDFITEIGKKPAGTYENRKATVLLDAPYNFEYKRLGKSRDDKYRIHAISRTSDYLKKLGYGSGNIIFFGSVGVNKDDKSKTEAYQRLGKRAVASISDMSGESSILTPSFDYIEHITRGYVPLDLLSIEDKRKSNDGRFIGRYRENNKSRSIEGGNYVLFDVLSEESQDNVKKYLSNYFLNQSNKMFEIINDYEKNKDKSYE